MSAAESAFADRKRLKKSCANWLPRATEITLLGQNVNSYGKDLGIDVDFSDLLRQMNAVPGDFWLRFYDKPSEGRVSKLFSTMAECGKVAKSSCICRSSRAATRFCTA